MRTLLALDSFKGSLSSKEVEAAFSQALTDCLAPDGTYRRCVAQSTLRMPFHTSQRRT